MRTNNRTTLGILYQCHPEWPCFGIDSLRLRGYYTRTLHSRDCMNAYPKATCDSTICFISEKAVAASSNFPFQIHSSLLHCSSTPLSFSACETVVRLSPLPPHRRSVHHNLQASVNKEGYNSRGLEAYSFTAPTSMFDNRFVESKPRTFPVCGVDDVDNY